MPRIVVMMIVFIITGRVIITARTGADAATPGRPASPAGTGASTSVARAAALAR
jgi:hypothetical protein